MDNTLQYITINDFETEKGQILPKVRLSYELAGPPLDSNSSVVLVNHALTGNSSVAGPEGWWSDLIGPGKAIPTEKYTILSFNIPGNCYFSEALPKHDLFTLKDVARLFLNALDLIGIKELYALLGASLGGGLVWQMAALRPQLSKRYIPIATHYKANDWLLAQTLVQEILLTSPHPLCAARVHGMLCYRTPESLDTRFGNEIDADGTPKVIDWLEYHGRRLEERFSLDAYKVMTYLTRTLHASDCLAPFHNIKDRLFLVSIDSDLLFPHYLTVQVAKELKAHHYTIHSIHGHDAFLIEYDRLSEIIIEIFNASLL